MLSACGSLSGLLGLLVFATFAFSFYLCSLFYDGTMGVNFVPYLLWSWSIAVGPWQNFVPREGEPVLSPNSVSITITLSSASALYFLFLVSIFISPALSFWLVVISALALVLLSAVNSYLAYKVLKYPDIVLGIDGLFNYNYIV